MPKTIIPIVVIACHFRKKDELCDTTLKRLSLARLRYSYLHGDDAYFIPTGDVPYERNSKTLADLMKEYLVSHGVPEDKVIIPDGVGIISEARSITANIKMRFPSCTKFIVFSSDWYFFPGGKIWRYFAKRNKLEVELVDVYDTGGVYTRLFYLCYGILVHISYLVGLQSSLEKFMNKLQGSRKEGFTFDGCK